MSHEVQICDITMGKDSFRNSTMSLNKITNIKIDFLPKSPRNLEFFNLKYLQIDYHKEPEENHSQKIFEILSYVNPNITIHINNKDHEDEDTYTLEFRCYPFTITTPSASKTY